MKSVSSISATADCKRFYEKHNWISYRSTCEQLSHEKFFWLAKAGPYASAVKPDALLAERIEGLMSNEITNWVTTIQHKDQQPATTYP